MRIACRPLAFLIVAGLVACSGSTDPGPVPPSIEILEGDGGQAVIAGRGADSLKVRVTDSDGMPIPGVFVGWTASAGAVSPSMIATDASGVAEALWSVYDPKRGFAALGSHTVTAAVYAAGSVTFTVHARAGVMPQSLVISPDHVNVDASDALVTVTVHATDDRTGFGVVGAYVQFYNPTATQVDFESWIAHLTLTSGTPADGVWQGSVSVPQGAEPGEWRLSRLALGWACSARREFLDRELDELGPHVLTVTSASEEGKAPLALPGRGVPSGVSVGPASAGSSAQGVSHGCSQGE